LNRIKPALVNPSVFQVRRGFYSGEVKELTLKKRLKENFRSYYWLAKCSRETNDHQQALTIYPANFKAKQLKKMLQKK